MVRDKSLNYLIKIDFDYPINTLINGNVTECINTLNDILKMGGVNWVHQQLLKIKENDLVNSRYNYILKQLR